MSTALCLKISLSTGLFGFETIRHYTLTAHASCFRLSAPTHSFLALDPFTLDIDYTPPIPQPTLADLQLEDLETFLLLTLINPTRTPWTTNLSAPLLINRETGQAEQILTPECPYHPLPQKLCNFAF